MFHRTRYYDPEVGRWFAIDPALQAVSPYMAMGNNPMMMVDEDGELAFLAVVGIGAAISALTYTGSVAFSDGGFSNWDWGQFAGNTLKGAAMSAITAGITTGIGDAFSGVSNGFIKTAGSAAAHGVGQGGISCVQGGSFGTGFVSGAMGSLGASAGNLGIGRLGYEITGAAGGSLGALVSGGDVLQGGITGGVIGLWNHGQHDDEPVVNVNLPEVTVTGSRAISLVMAGLGGRFGDDYLGFTGARSPGRTRVDGTLTWYRNTAVGPEIVKTWTARSGSRSLLPTPHGEWELSNWRKRTKQGFVKDGVGFSVDITPDPMHNRQYLRIHPDGGLPGTAGCIGLTGNAQELRLFSSMIRNHLSQYGPMRLNVGYTIPSVQLYP
ncbi:RHS repeat-associated core domain-containing protein [Marinifilum sp. RC60d5]|uniref:RHS repeat-associated core domain-containing protein n=1 Tax=Marinifilum sp. RC60d5 TaxID=3458414 RepID=UPI004036771E